MMMKARLFLVFMWFCLAIPIFAQEEEVNRDTVTTSLPVKKSNFWIGPKFGLDMSPVIPNQFRKQLQDNFQMGIMMQFGKKFYFQPEIYYASYKHDSIVVRYGYAGSEQPIEGSVNFIRIPLMVGLKFLDLGLFSFHIQTGPVVNFRLSDTAGLSGDNTFSWQAGAGIDILGFITTDVRYTIQKGSSIGDQINQFNRNRSLLNVTVGLKFR